jgi:hypothetical protein
VRIPRLSDELTMRESKEIIEKCGDKNNRTTKNQNQNKRKSAISNAITLFITLNSQRRRRDLNCSHSPKST